MLVILLDVSLETKILLYVCELLNFKTFDVESYTNLACICESSLISELENFFKITMIKN